MPVLDPFTGSGTVQVEALARGMPSVGIDIDPLACFVTKAKTTLVDPGDLDEGLEQIESVLGPYCRDERTVAGLAANDLSEAAFEAGSQGLWYPAIPNLEHWFRRYVVIDVARLLWAIGEARLGEERTRFFRACVASIIRYVSNADPYPVSALEVSSVQAARNATREIDVFATFAARARRHIEGMAALVKRCGGVARGAATDIVCGDTLSARKELSAAELPVDYPLVVTSPPYCTAVNYSRRHKLEMYWLGFVRDRDDHVDLTHSYLGRRWVRVGDWDDCGELGLSELDRALVAIGERKRARSRALRHYFWSMRRALAEIGTLMDSGGVLICATGDSVSCGIPVETTRFLVELASEQFALANHFSYTLRNRYMQYPLRNGPGIRREHVLVFQRRPA
jgi:hypothetical protein